MNNNDLKRKILYYLESSTISEHEKEMVRILLPVMKQPVLQDIYDALKKEKQDMNRLDKKQERIELKYKVMVEKLCDMEIKKFK